MLRPFVVKRAGELLDAEFTAKWQDRQTLSSRPRTVLGTILAEFIRSGGPVKIDDIVVLLPALSPAEVTRVIRELDERDVILVADALVTVAYPIATGSSRYTGEAKAPPLDLPAALRLTQAPGWRL